MVECDFQMSELNTIRDCLIDKVDRGSNNPYHMEFVITIFKKVDELMEQERCK